MRDWPPTVIGRYRRAVFLDRDGTLNEDTHFPYRLDDLTLLPGTLDGLKVLAKQPLGIVVVSNQAGIALGRFTRADMAAFNEELRRRVEEVGGRIDAFYFCPHPEPKHLSMDTAICGCSKPAPGMLLEAARELGIVLRESFVVGDRGSDIAAGASVGCVTILVRAQGGGREKYDGPLEPNYVVPHLLEAALLIESKMSSDE